MARTKFILQRVIQLVPLLLGVMLVSFLLLRLSPGDPAQILLGPRATPEQLVAKRAELGLDKNLVTQFGTYVGHVARGDLGDSIRAHKPVTTVISDRLEVTLWILTGTIVLSLVIAVPLAILAARKPHGVLDQATRGLSMLGFSLPTYWVGIMLILVVAVPTGWFPVQGFGKGAWGHLRAVVLPCLTLAVAMAPVLLRSLRSAILDVLASDHTWPYHALCLQFVEPVNQPSGCTRSRHKFSL